MLHYAAGAAVPWHASTKGQCVKGVLAYCPQVRTYHYDIKAIETAGSRMSSGLHIDDATQAVNGARLQAYKLFLVQVRKASLNRCCRAAQGMMNSCDMEQATTGKGETGAKVGQPGWARGLCMCESLLLLVCRSYAACLSLRFLTDISCTLDKTGT